MCRYQDRSYDPNLPVPCQPGRIHHRPGTAHLLHVQGGFHPSIQAAGGVLLHGVVCHIWGGYLMWPTVLLQKSISVMQAYMGVIMEPPMLQVNLQVMHLYLWICFSFQLISCYFSRSFALCCSICSPAPAWTGQPSRACIASTVLRARKLSFLQEINIVKLMDYYVFRLFMQPLFSG